MKPQFDLETYLNEKGAIPLTKKHEWSLTCPICGKEDKLQVNTEKKLWHCWVCETYTTRWDGRKTPIRGAGNLVSLIQLLEGCSKEQAKAILSSGVVEYSVGDDIETPEIQNLNLSNPIIPIFPEIKPPEHWLPIQSNLPYCEKRGISIDDVNAYGLTYCVQGRYRNRLIFPVWENGRLLYYQARAMYDAPGDKKFVKSLNPPKLPGTAGATDVVFNLDRARHFERVVVTEGPIDAIHAGPDAIATFGKKISMVQILKLYNAGVRKIDLAWDGPGPTEPRGAWDESVRAASKLSGIFDVRVVFLPAGDPGEYSREQFSEFRKQAVPQASVSRLALL